MFTTSKRRLQAASLAAAFALPLSFAACSSTDTSAPEPSDSASETTSASAAPTPSPTTSEATTADAAAATFGAGCSLVPTTGAGSFAEMATVPVATAASQNPLLTTLVTAARTAGLVDTLNNAEDITVFAPTDGAFAAVDPAALARLLGNPSQLSTVLTTHVVQGRLAPDQLAGSHQTLSGATITVEGSGEDFTVDGNAKVVCGNVQTANATVYIIDQVLATDS
jgi:uncharacterized surface protein with fasciclin (FAS1) repeats